MSRLKVFLDTETTGLDPTVHEAYEVAWAVEDGPVNALALPHTLNHATPESLKISNYWSRGFSPFMLRNAALGELRTTLTDVTIVAANPAFDVSFLRKTFNAAPWHYRLWDIEAYAAGVLGWNELRGLHSIAEFLRDLGHDIPVPDHSAAADVLTLRACFRVLEVGP